MKSSRKLAETAIGANAMVWFGLAVFTAGIAAELAPGVFRQSAWGAVVGWVFLLLAAAGLAVIGAVEVTRLTLRLRRQTS